MSLSTSRQALLLLGALAVQLVALSPRKLLAVAPSPPLVGVVKTADGQPVSQVQVIVVQLNRVATTNDSGAFRFTALPAGRYHLTAMRIGLSAAHTDVTIPESGAEVNVTIIMHEAAMQLSTVQVTATPTGADPRDVPQAVTTLSGQELARQISSSVAQSPSEQPGLAVRFNGPAATAPVIRGLQGERVLVLQDGDRAADLSSAAPDHGVSIDPLTAERVEVVRGPASLLYGNSALGGVVNVISNDIPTSIPTHIDGYVATQLESVNPGGGVAAGATIPIGQGLAVVARAGARHTDPLHEGGGTILTNSFYHNYYGVGGLGFGTNRATGGIIYRGYKFDYGLPTNSDELSKID